MTTNLDFPTITQTMNSKDLSRQWARIKPSANEAGFRLLRITSESLAELSLGLDSASKRCLVLTLPASFTATQSSRACDNLSIEVIYGGTASFLIIKLEERFFNDLFDDLVISIYDNICDMEEPEKQAKRFIQIFHKWSDFFTSSPSGRLSREQIQGLLGELKLLSSLLNVHTKFEINELLRAWRGPYDESADFILDDRNIEAKTILTGKRSVQISSEKQMAIEPAKGLELTVFEVEPDPRNGVSLSMQLEALKQKTYDRLGDFTIILEALRQKNLNMSNVSDYDNLRFAFRSKKTFNAANVGFPKLISDNTPGAIHAIRYSIKLPLITEYLIEEQIYER